jgi:hypothetical protein
MVIVPFLFLYFTRKKNDLLFVRICPYVKEIKKTTWDLLFLLHHDSIPKFMAGPTLFPRTTPQRPHPRAIIIILIKPFLLLLVAHGVFGGGGGDNVL